MPGPTIGLLGDVMLGRRVADRLAPGPPADVWSNRMRAVCSACDAIVLNLECCISTRGSPTDLIPGKPFFFRAPPAGAEALRALGTSVVASVANNHALDFGQQALLDTVTHLGNAAVAAAGAGADVDAARRGPIVSAGGTRLGVLALSDHPREYAAGSERPGIAYAELARAVPDWAFAELARLRLEADVVVAFLHWGANMTDSPAGWQRKRAGELLDAGADAVAGHSAHIFHGIAGGPVLYDLGDALDDYAVDLDLRNDLGVLALWRPFGDRELELVGLTLEYCRTDLAQGDDADWIARRLSRACASLGTRVERLDEARFAVTAKA